MAGKPKTFDGYLAALSRDQRAALEKLRKAVRAAAPRAVECISYGLPAFRLDGKMLVALGIRFPADNPLPATLVRKLVRARIAENAG